jgi:hypothetical protein
LITPPTGKEAVVATIFPTRPGQVAMLDGSAENDLGLPLAVDGIYGSWFPGFQAILVGLQFTLAGNFQMTHTCANIVYIYAFGDRITSFRVSGMAFSDGCAGRSTGIEQVLAYYKANRIAVRSTPVQLQIGTTDSGRFRGYMTEMQGEIARAESRVSQFSLVFQVLAGS